MKIIYVCERCGREWDKEVRFCPICYTGLITKAEWNKNKLRKSRKRG